MGLNAVDDTPGLWVGEEWKSGTPGLFAVVIGVSAYDHLNGSPETYNLGQLRVSALTAYRVFEWLRDDFKLDGCPIANVWLLLAPTDQEKEFEPALVKHSLAPTIDNCEYAISHWQAAMQTLPSAVAEKSRAFFFFSGHGLEIHQNRQILLPADYLKPPASNVNNALSTENLVNGLASLKVPRQFFFLDACRNDNQELRNMRVEGRRVLNEEVAAFSNPEIIAPILYATASGQQAFQQPDPTQGLSLFGRALLDGLNGKPDIELKSFNGGWSVNVYPLQGYVKSRIVKLLEEAQERVRQPVKLGGVTDNEVIALAPPPKKVVLMSPTIPLTGRQRADKVGKKLAAPFSVSRPIPKIDQDGGWSKKYDVTHEAFGAETATALWWNLRLTALSTGAQKSSENITLYHVAHAPDTRRFRVELSPIDQDPLGHWLELDDGICLFGTVLPSDQSGSLRYLIEFDFEYDNEGPSGKRRISRMEAALAPTQPGPAGIAADLWDTYNASDAETAAQVFQDPKLAERLLAEKTESPLAAAIATLVLLRAGRLDLLHNWVRNVANWFPSLPDGVTLWAEQLLRQSKQKPDVLNEAARYTSSLFDRGFPLLAETVGYAAKHIDMMLRDSDAIDPELLPRLRLLQERMEQALVYFRSDGLFPVYTEYKDSKEMLKILGLGYFRALDTPQYLPG